jgi:hypothetical protein
MYYPPVFGVRYGYVGTNGSRFRHHLRAPVCLLVECPNGTLFYTDRTAHHPSVNSSSHHQGMVKRIYQRIANNVL